MQDRCDYFIIKKSKRPFLKKLAAFFSGRETGTSLEDPREFEICGPDGKQIMSGKADDVSVAHRIGFSAGFAVGSALVPVLGSIAIWIIAASVFFYIVASKKRSIYFGDGGEFFFKLAPSRLFILHERYSLTDAAGRFLGSVMFKWSLKDPAGLWKCLDKDGRRIYRMRSSPVRGSDFSLIRRADGTVAGKVKSANREIILELKDGRNEDLRILTAMIAVAFRPF